MATARRVTGAEEQLNVAAAAWCLVILAAFLRWGGSACLPWRGHRDGRHLVAAAHVAASIVMSAMLGTWLDASVAGTLGVVLTVAASWALGGAASRTGTR